MEIRKSIPALFIFTLGAFSIMENHTGEFSGMESTAGAAFTPETPVVITSASQVNWIFAPFPQPPALNITHLQIAKGEHQYLLRKIWEGKNRHQLCGDKTITEAWFNTTDRMIDMIIEEQRATMEDVASMRQRAIMETTSYGNGCKVLYRVLQLLPKIY